MDQKDMALELRQRLGDWFRVLQLIQMGGAGDDRMLLEANNKIGEYYAERQRWYDCFKHVYIYQIYIKFTYQFSIFQFILGTRHINILQNQTI